MPGNSFLFAPVTNLPWSVGYLNFQPIVVNVDGSTTLGLNAVINTWADGQTLQINGATVVDYYGYKIFDQNHAWYDQNQNVIFDNAHAFWDASGIKVFDNNHLFYDQNGNGAMQFATNVTQCINPVQFNGGTKSSDGSAGMTGTLTTASLVGKTVTIKNGLIVSIA